MKQPIEKDTRLSDSFIVALVLTLVLVVGPIVGIVLLFVAPWATITMIITYVLGFLWLSVYEDMS